MSYWANGPYDKIGQLESEDVTGNMMSDPLFLMKNLSWDLVVTYIVLPP